MLGSPSVHQASRGANGVRRPPGEEPPRLFNGVQGLGPVFPGSPATGASPPLGSQKAVII